jgi:exodeoxyribonuclease V alpha subunit
VSVLTPDGSAKERFTRARGAEAAAIAEPQAFAADEDAFVPAYLGWEIARCAPGLSPEERRALEALVAACLAALRAGSTRMPVDDARLAAALASGGAADSLDAARAMLARARAGGDHPVTAVIGRAGERKPLVVEGDWLSTEKMRAVEEGFCARIRPRGQGSRASSEDRSHRRAVQAVAGGPPALSDEQKGAVREALARRLALVTGGPGTGKTTIVVALLRALHWAGVPMESVAIAAPTGKAAHRLEEAIGAGLAAAPRDIAEAGLATTAPAPQTLHRLLGWSPGKGRFARHENDPLPHAVVVVDEASMIDLVLMDRLVRALRDDARLVLLGDADQLPSVEAGAVFRDLCAGLGAVRLTRNLRVASDPAARRIVDVAHAVNSGVVDARFTAAVATRQGVDEVAFEGVEQLDASFAGVVEALLDRWWRTHVAAGPDLERRSSRVYALRDGAFGDEDRVDLRALLDHNGRARILAATRVQGFPACTEAINERLVARLPRAASSPPGRRSATRLPPGAPVLVQRNDYERRLYNGDQGIVVRVDRGDGQGPEPMAVFARGERFDAWPLEEIPDLAPAFAMTVHKAQGSEFDHVALVLPDEPLPLLTRELVYTAITRARRSVLLVGRSDLLARAVSRTVERYSGIAERLVSP